MKLALDVLGRTGKIGLGAALFGVYIIVKSAGGNASTGALSKSDVAERFRLNAHEMKAYDACRSELSRHYLRDGGDMSRFCGCFAKDATENLNDGHKAKAATFFASFVKSKTFPASFDRHFPQAAYRGHTGTAKQAGLSVIKAANACAEDANEARASQTANPRKS